MSTVKIALIQMSAVGHGASANKEKAFALVKKAAKHKAKIICLQELFATYYFPQKEHTRPFDLAEPIPGPTTEALGQIARATKTVIIAPLFEKRTKGLYHNSAAVIGTDGSLLGVYRKTHIPDDPGFYEKYYFSPGDLGFRTFKTPFGTIGILICWDQWFPEAARLCALQGADIIFYPTAIGGDTGEKPGVIKQQINAWETVQISHAITNGVFVASVNRVGLEKKIRFWGRSFISSPYGKILSRAKTGQNEIVYGNCDLSLVKKSRIEWPFLRDRRIDLYHNLTALYSGNNKSPARSAKPAKRIKGFGRK